MLIESKDRQPSPFRQKFNTWISGHHWAVETIASDRCRPRGDAVGGMAGLFRWQKGGGYCKKQAARLEKDGRLCNFATINKTSP